MLESVDRSRGLARPRYVHVLPPLQDPVRLPQSALHDARVPTLVVFEGWDGAGKSTVIQRLTERLDPRVFRHTPSAPPSELERRYHFLWRYQMRLPEDGQIGFFDHSWYGRVLVERVEKLTPRKQWKLAYDQINAFERWLADDGQVIVKFFLHISKREQKRRLRRMEEDPVEHWKVQKQDWRRNRRYDDWAEAAEDMLAKTHTSHAPWTVVAATDFRHLRHQVFETLVARMEEALARHQGAPQPALAQKRKSAALERARATAREAGLPLDEA